MCVISGRVDAHKQVSISKKTASLCAADVTLKEFAQRVISVFKLQSYSHAIVAYIMFVLRVVYLEFLGIM